MIKRIVARLYSCYSASSRARFPRSTSADIWIITGGLKRNSILNDEIGGGRESDGSFFERGQDRYQDCQFGKVKERTVNMSDHQAR